MATLDDLEGVLKSIDTTMKEQKTLLTNMLSAQATRDRLSSVNTSTIGSTASGVGQGIGSAAAGVGQGVGSAAMGLGLGGLAGLAALAIFANFDAQAIKDNVLTLLSISDEVGGNLAVLYDGGSVGLALGGLGIGIGLFGIGQILVGLGQWITDDQWTQTLKTNVVDLLSISDEVGGNLALLYSGGSVALALAGLGIGLASFGTGQAFIGLGQWVTDDTWAETVKSNVVTLLSIADDLDQSLTQTLAEGGTFAAVMYGLGWGLKKFAIGAGISGISELIADWAAGGNWAEEVKNNVATLLTIGTLANDDLVQTFARTGAFAAVMFGLGFGLGELAIGASLSGLSELLADWAGDGNWTKEVKNNVATLLSIAQLEGIGGDTLAFAAIMGGIGAGLLAFSAGALVNGVTELITDWASGGNWAEEVKNNVAALLSIPGMVGDTDPQKFTDVMSKLGDGLSAFAGGNFVGTLKNLGTELLGFFFGVKSPFEQIRAIAADADNLLKAADALDKIAGALEKFGSIDIGIGDTDFVKLAENLGKAIPLLSALANGGEVEGSDGWLSSPLIFPKSILDPSLKLDEMAEAISKVNYILGQTTQYPIGLQQGAAAATEESPVISSSSDLIRMDRDRQAVTDFQKRLETVAMNDRAGPITAISNSGNTNYAPVDIRQIKTDVSVQPKYNPELDSNPGFTSWAAAG